MIYVSARGWIAVVLLLMPALFGMFSAGAIVFGSLGWNVWIGALVASGLWLNALVAVIAWEERRSVRRRRSATSGSERL